MALVIRPFSGYMVDSFPRKTVLIICGVLFFGIFVGYLAAGSLAAFAVFRTLHGAPFGATTVAASTVAIDNWLLRTKQQPGYGIGTGSCNCIA